jgi:hypothetical protein
MDRPLTTGLTRDEVDALQYIHDVSIANLRALMVSEDLSDAEEWIRLLSRDHQSMKQLLAWIALGVRSQFVVEGKDAA